VTDKTVVACFDVATSVGVCVGHAGAREPFVTTWNLRAAGTSRPRRLFYFSNLCDELFKRSAIDIVRFEAPMPLAVMAKIGTSEETMLLLRGAIGVLEASAARANVEDIGSFSVQDARQHFLGRRTFPKGKNGKSAAKDMVLIMCDTLGIKVENDNESDAVCGWHYCCALINPRTAMMVTPLFQESP
jgi:hypothetical protein